MSTPLRGQPHVPALVGLALLLTAVLSGCAEPGAAPPAGVEPTPVPTPAEAPTDAPPPQPAPEPTQAALSDDPFEAALDYARCIRDNGFPEWPDPEPDGRIMIRRGDGMSFNDPRRMAAMEACQALRPPGMGAGIGGGLGQGGLDQEALLAFARCMRENGVPEFPDPGAAGGGPVIIGPGSGIDPNHPTFQAALQTCRAQIFP